MSCGIGCRRGADTSLLWLWWRLSATAPIGPLAWEPPYAAGVAQEMAKRQKKKTTVLHLKSEKHNEIYNKIPFMYIKHIHTKSTYFTGTHKKV